ncbi:WbqC family protein [Bradyrhizobium sp.]|uniref:WbqC family protein n=1 Tax=Bradyrhizobium sp. TaxID=376 RepID=UPI001D626694|nr:WbqC family protein [Bradyrhizobium sp.]MBI5321115.1 WbqC family protein [Bradyrhizobium sp.]
MRICIIQSCYVPWKGFFDLIGRCDEYVIYDSAQYSKGHWHNRNRIKTAQGLAWLTIPVITAGHFKRPIREIKVQKPWADKHWNIVELAYRRAPYFEQVAPIVKDWYERASTHDYLTDVNFIFLQGVVEFLGLKTRIVRDDVYQPEGGKMERLLKIVGRAGADRYLSGPAARAYFDESAFKSAGITVEWMSYEGYPQYKQLHGTFEHAVSVLDLLFNTGPEARFFSQGGRVEDVGDLSASCRSDNS